MIRLFNSIETDFTHNGIQVLDDIVYGDSCILLNGINEVYSLEMEISKFNNEKWKDIQEEMLLRVPTPKGEQLFRIKEISQNFNSLKIYGQHVFFDLNNNFILDTNIVQKDGNGAINQILSSMSNNTVNQYFGTSDIAILNNARLVRKNVASALLGDKDNSFLSRWGGELEVDNFNFSFKQRIGQDRGFQIRYGKNAKAYEGNINTYGLCTRIVPVGFNGIMLDNPKWVDSEYITKYPQIYTYEVKFDDIKVKENPDDEDGYSTLAEAQQALIEAVNKYFKDTKCDLPQFNAKIKFYNNQDTLEYSDVKALEKVDLGDDVHVYLTKLCVDIESRVVKIKYNFFTQKYIEIEVGEIKSNSFKDIVKMKDLIDGLVEDLGGNTWQDIINKSLDEATKLMAEGLKDSFVVTMKNQIIIGDAPKIEDMVNCIVMNKNGIGFSNSGYLPDRLISAMTIDGKINASCITTGQLNATIIKTGIIKSLNNNTYFDLDTGVISSKMPDGSEILISPTEGFYNKFGANKRAYHHLFYSGEVELRNIPSVVIQLPDEFKNKNFSVNLGVNLCYTNGSAMFIQKFGSRVKNINIANGTFEIFVDGTGRSLRSYADLSTGQIFDTDAVLFTFVIAYNVSA